MPFVVVATEPRVAFRRDTRKVPELCAYCGARGSYLCDRLVDFKTKRTCSTPMCTDCATYRPGQGHVCKEHGG